MKEFFTMIFVIFSIFINLARRSQVYLKGRGVIKPELLTQWYVFGIPKTSFEPIESLNSDIDPLCIGKSQFCQQLSISQQNIII